MANLFELVRLWMQGNDKMKGHILCHFMFLIQACKLGYDKFCSLVFAFKKELPACEIMSMAGSIL